MHREDLFINDSGYRETIKAIRERLPQFDVVAAFACQCHQNVHRQGTQHGHYTHSS
jgi:hypothetical protein